MIAIWACTRKKHAMTSTEEKKCGDRDVCHASYVLVSNPSNRNNLGTVIRCAVAFGAQAVVIVGASRFSTHGAHGAQKHMPVVHFPTFEQAVARMRELGCSVLGIAATNESHEGSVAVDTRPFNGPTAFVVGDLQHGELSSELAALCDGVVHVSLPSSPEVQRLVHKDSKLSIALHHFTAWSGYKEHEFQEHKYVTQMYASEKERQLYMDARVREIRGAAAAEEAIDAVRGEGASADDNAGESGQEGDEGTAGLFGLRSLQETADY